MIEGAQAGFLRPLTESKTDRRSLLSIEEGAIVNQGFESEEDLAEMISLKLAETTRGLRGRMIKLQNKTGELDFAKEISDGYRIRHGTYQLRGSIIDRYGKDGGEEVGDKRIRARSLMIEFSLAKQEQKDYAGLFNQLISFFS